MTEVEQSWHFDGLEQIIARLNDEVDHMSERFSEVEPTVGDAMFVEFDPEFTANNQIGRFGRMTKKEGTIKFHAAPAELDRTKYYHLDPMNAWDIARKWSLGQDNRSQLEHLSRLPNDPDYERKEHKRKTQDYERQLFQVLGRSWEITLLNPSFSTMSALKGACGGYVSLTGNTREDWAADVVDFVRNSDGRLRMLPANQVRGMTYLGTNVPRWYPDTPWVRLILSPFVTNSTLFPEYQIDIQDTCILTSFRKKERIVTSILDRDSGNYMYNPETVDEVLGIKEGTKWFFLESSKDLDVDEKDDQKVLHSPWFLDQVGEWVIISGHEWRVCGNYVTDVVGPGTYLSRRMRYRPPPDLEWMPFSQSGSHWITYSSLKPRRHYGVMSFVDKNVKFITFDDAVPIKRLALWQSNFEYQVVSKPVCGYHNYPLLSDEELYLVEMPYKDFLQLPCRIESFLMDENHRVYRYGQFSASGICVQAGGKYSPGGFVLGRPMSVMSVVKTQLRTYCLVPKVTEGVYFLVPERGDLEYLGSTMSMFHTNWMITRDTIRTDGPNTMVSTDLPSQAVLASLDFDINSILDRGKTITQISHEIKAPVYRVARYVSTLPGVVAIKAETTTEYCQVSRIKLRVGEFKDSSLSDGALWSSILLGTGKRKERYKFQTRELRFLIRFLKLNYCMVHIRDWGPWVEMSVRRPR